MSKPLMTFKDLQDLLKKLEPSDLEKNCTVLLGTNERLPVTLVWDMAGEEIFLAVHSSEQNGHEEDEEETEEPEDTTDHPEPPPQPEAGQMIPRRRR